MTSQKVLANATNTRSRTLHFAQCFSDVIVGKRKPVLSRTTEEGGCAEVCDERSCDQRKGPPPPVMFTGGGSCDGCTAWAAGCGGTCTTTVVVVVCGGGSRFDPPPTDCCTD